MTAKNAIGLIAAIATAEAAGIIGSVFTASAIPDWYEGLVKPAFNPPSRLFGPVWTLLYALMGIALYLVWQKRAMAGAKTALAVFFIQLALNTAWSVIFFGARNPGLALAEIAFLWAAVVLTIFLFARLDRRAAVLLLPYIAWVSFAAVLNFYIWKLN